MKILINIFKAPDHITQLVDINKKMSSMIDVFV
jgi:hypothetical protein